MRSGRARVIALVTATVMALAIARLASTPGTEDPEPVAAGAIRIDVMLLPDDVDARVHVVGRSSYDVEHDVTLADLRPGEYTVSAAPVTSGGRTLYPEVPEQSVAVRPGRSAYVRVSYTTVIPDTTRVLTPIELYSGVDVADDGALLRFSDTVVAPDVGDVIVAGVSSQTPLGLLRRVTRVRPTSDGVVVVTEPATLEQAVSRGRFSVHRELELEQLAHEVSTPRAVQLGEGSFVLTIGGEGRKGLVLPCAPGAKARVEGRLEVDAAFDFSASWGLFRGARIEAASRFVEDASFQVSATGDAACSKKVELLRTYLSPVIAFVGPVPVVITPLLTATLKLSGGVTSKLSLEGSQHASLTLGLKYDDGALESIRRFDKKFESPGADVSPVAVTAKAAVGPSLELLLYGAAGPSADVSGHLRVEVAPYERPWWQVFGGLDGSAGISVDMFGGRIKADARWHLVDWERRLARARGRPPPRPVEEDGLFDSIADCDTGGCSVIMRHDGLESPKGRASLLLVRLPDETIRAYVVSYRNEILYAEPRDGGLEGFGLEEYPLTPVVDDRNGNIFVTLAVGGHSEYTLVFRITKTTVSDLGSIGPKDRYGSHDLRFLGDVPVRNPTLDRDGDGYREITVATSDYEPSYVAGKVYTSVYEWDGTNYVLAKCYVGRLRTKEERAYPPPASGTCKPRLSHSRDG